MGLLTGMMLNATRNTANIACRETWNVDAREHAGKLLTGYCFPKKCCYQQNTKKGGPGSIYSLQKASPNLSIIALISAERSLLQRTDLSTGLLTLCIIIFFFVKVRAETLAKMYSNL